MFFILLPLEWLKTIVFIDILQVGFQESPLGGLGHHFRGIWGLLGTLWGPLGTLLGPSWSLLGPFSTLLDPLGTLLGSLGDPFEPSWDPLGPFRDPFRPSLVHFGPQSDAQASNMLILDHKTLDRRRKR